MTGNVIRNRLEVFDITGTKNKNTVMTKQHDRS